MKSLKSILLGAVVAAAGCGGDGDDTGASASGGSTSAGSTSQGSTSQASTSGSTGDPTTGATGGSSSGATTGQPGYCQGFDVGAASPFLEMRLKDGTAIADGLTWPLECGGQGFWMFGLYPSLGGWDPGSNDAIFSITVDVEGFNTNPDGHFYSNTMEYYYIGCEQTDGGVVGVIGVLPPDGIADLALLDGKMATVHVEISGGGQLLGADATMTLSAPAAQVMQGCGFG
jgi:ABC-type transport system substrate-binding protein